MNLKVAQSLGAGARAFGVLESHCSLDAPLLLQLRFAARVPAMLSLLLLLLAAACVLTAPIASLPPPSQHNRCAAVRPAVAARSGRGARVLCQAATATKTVKIGTRGSPLALAQAYMTRDLLKVRVVGVCGCGCVC